MKKIIIPLMFAAAIFTSCEKDPSLDVVQDQIVTYTQFDKNTDFMTASTFYIAEQILLINKNEEQQYMKDEYAIPVINELINEMNSRGYTQVSEKEEADFGIQMSYIESTYYFAVRNDPYWWNSYPGYWGPSFWGPYWGDWYYPYVNIFSYTNSSLLTDIVNLKAKTSDSTGQKLPVVWQAYSIGLLGNNSQQTVNNMISGIKQAFKQSPYLTKVSVK